MKNTIERQGVAGRSTGTRFWVGACLLAAIAVFFLWEEHEAHILGAVPYLLFLACPLIHLFMHQGHAHGRDGGQRERSGHSRAHAQEDAP